MKPIISHSDYTTLKALIANYPAHLTPKEAAQLKDELNKALIVTDTEIDNTVIRLNSHFEAEDTATKKVWKLTLALPNQANVKESKISVFSPMGIALLGFKKGMTVKWELPGGLKTIKIREVING